MDARMVQYLKISKYNLSYEKAEEEKLRLINSIRIYEKNSQKHRNRGALSQVDKGHLQKAATNFVLNVEKTEAFP